MMELLYRWPEAARFGRPVPKASFYQNAKVSVAVRSQFVSDVQRITWAYKLAEVTINLPDSSAVPEIQVFEVVAKDDDVAESVLATIDKAIYTPIIFEVNRGEGASRRTRMTASYKQLGAGMPRLGAYYTTDWQVADLARKPLPTAVTLSALYIALLAPLSPVEARLGEEISDVAARLGTVHRLEREVASLERKLRTESQLNRKIQLRRALKDRQAALESLI